MRRQTCSAAAECRGSVLSTQPINHKVKKWLLNSIAPLAFGDTPVWLKNCAQYVIGSIPEAVIPSITSLVARVPSKMSPKRSRPAPWSELAKKFEKHVADRNLSREERQLAADVMRQIRLSREETEKRDNVDKKGKVQKNKRKEDE